MSDDPVFRLRRRPESVTVQELLDYIRKVPGAEDENVQWTVDWIENVRAKYVNDPRPEAATFREGSADGTQAG